MSKSMNQTSTNVSRVEMQSFERSRVFGWFAAFGLVALATILGNTLTITAFSRRQVQKKRARFLLVNLAVTDLMVGSITVPLYIYVIGGQFWTIYPAALAVFKTMDSITGLASIFSISVISLERLFSIGWPIRHRNSTIRPYIAAITMTWLYAGVVPTLQTVFQLFSFETYAHVVVLSLSTPLVVTVISYCFLWIKKRRYSARMSCRRVEQEDVKLARTLLVVAIVFFFSWMPFLVLSAKILYSCSINSCFAFSPDVLNFTKLLHYGNSCANPIIYTMRISSFRLALKSMFGAGPRERGNSFLVNVVAPFSTRASPSPLPRECSLSVRIELLHLSDVNSNLFRCRTPSISRQIQPPKRN